MSSGGVREEQLLIVDAENPRNAYETAFDTNFDLLALTETIEILARDSYAFYAAAVAPRSYDELMHGKKTGHGEPTDYGDIMIFWR